MAIAQNQPSSGASQTVSLALANVVQITQFSTGSGNSGPVEMPLAGTNVMANGIESPEYSVSINSTNGFSVKAQAVSEYFTYTGNATTNTNMRVSDVLQLKVANNSTTGTVAGGHTSYQPVSGSAQSQIINNGSRGANQTFAIKYKATPGYNYSGGNYSASILYTVTQF
ncbi:hypothetical protein CAP35_13050 [Chitinophagaceae bacterium IBVUCB1]|nr:hypothetical protein CAP35_13050 [Chitinophagaceae bacterium IBVUCB1]